jgi:hypothetical protein
MKWLNLSAKRRMMDRITAKCYVVAAAIFYGIPSYACWWRQVPWASRAGLRIKGIHLEPDGSDP